MSCPEHTHCARTGNEGHLCPFCHCSFAVITMPATEVTRRPGKSKAGLPIVVEETKWLFGRGELPLQHLIGHVEDRRRVASKAAKLAERRAAA